MNSSEKFWMRIWTIVAVSLTIITITMGGCTYKSNVLVAQQTTCYGKIIQQSWANTADQILALNACGNQSYDYSVN